MNIAVDAERAGVLLIVEDDLRMGDTMAEMFAPFFSRIERCVDGLEAVSRYESVDPEVVVMDILLPGIDGLEATERIRRLHPDARVFIVTAFDEPRYRERAARCGASGFFLKDDLSALYSPITTLPPTA